MKRYNWNMKSTKDLISAVLVVFGTAAVSILLLHSESLNQPEPQADAIPPVSRVWISPWHDIQQRNDGWIFGGERVEAIGCTITDENGVIIGRTSLYTGDRYAFSPRREHEFLLPPEFLE